MNPLVAEQKTYSKNEKCAIALLAIYFLIAIVFNLIFLLETVPIDISAKTEDGKKTVVSIVTYKSTPGSLVTYLVGSPIDVNTHLALIVIFGGSLGGLIHGLASLAYHSKKCTFNLKSILWYVVRPFIGAALALAIYFAFRGGVLTSVSVDVLNPYGVTTIAILTGLAGDKVTKKLKEVFETFFLKDS
jgi:hypothetical protein